MQTDLAKVDVHELVKMIDQVIAKAKEMDDGSEQRLPYRRAALKLGYGDALASFLNLAMHWENDINTWCDLVLKNAYKD